MQPRPQQLFQNRHFSSKTSRLQLYMTGKRWSLPSMFNKRDHVSELLLIYATNEEFEWAKGAILDKLEMQKMKCVFALQRKCFWHDICCKTQTVFLFFLQVRYYFAFLDSELLQNYFFFYKNTWVLRWMDTNVWLWCRSFNTVRVTFLWKCITFFNYNFGLLHTFYYIIQTIYMIKWPNTRLINSHL